MYYLQNKAEIMPKNLADTKLFKALNFSQADMKNYEKLGFATKKLAVFRDLDFNSYVKLDINGLYFKPITKEILQDWVFNEFYENRKFFNKKIDSEGKEEKEIIDFDDAFAFDMKKNFLRKAVSSGHIVFDPHKPRFLFENKIVEINRFFQTEIAKKALKKRAESSKNVSNGLFENQEGFQGLYQDLKFLDKYPYTKAFLKNLFCYNCESEEEADERLAWVLAWMSKSFVNYDKRETAIVIHGSEGTGKDTFVRVYFKRYYSDNFCSVVSNERLKSNFSNQSLAFSLLCQLNEIKGDFRDGNTVFEKIKYLITAEVFEHELKGVNPVTLPCYFNIIICSNDTKPIQVSETARRYSVFYSGKSLRVLAQETFNNDTGEFLKNLEKEADNFLIDLVCFNYEISKPDECLNTREVGILQEVTNSKITIFANNLKNKNIEKIKEETIENAKEFWHKPNKRQDLISYFKGGVGVNEEELNKFANSEASFTDGRYSSFDFFVGEVIEAFFERFEKIKSVQGVALGADLRIIYQINIGLAKNVNEITIKLQEHLHLKSKTFVIKSDLKGYSNKYFEIPENYRGFKLWDEEIQF